jgi:hypothetical protein
VATHGHTYTQGWSGQGFAIPRGPPEKAEDNDPVAMLGSSWIIFSHKISRVMVWLLKLIPVVSWGVSEGLALVLSRIVWIRWQLLDPSWLWRSYTWIAQFMFISTHLLQPWSRENVNTWSADGILLTNLQRLSKVLRQSAQQKQSLPLCALN